MRAFLRAALAAAVFLCVALRGQCASTFSSDASDLWWNPDESGWGINIEQQGNVVFATLFVYGPDGRAHWYVAPNAEAGSASSPIVFSGALFETTGPSFSTSFNPNLVGTRQVGTLSFAYTPPGAALLNYSVDGVAVQKNVFRQTWRNTTLARGYEIWFGSSRGTSCTSGSFGGAMVVYQTGSSVHIDVYGTGSFSPRCSMDGTILQIGRMATISGTATCGGTTGGFLFDDMEIGIHGFTGHYHGQDLGGCIDAHVAGTFTDAP